MPLDWQCQNQNPAALEHDASGAGCLALTDFWQTGDRQYGMGTFTWPSGETDTLLLVRP